MTTPTNVPFNEAKLVEECQVTNEETYRAVLDTFLDGYFEATPEGVLTYVNQAFVNSIGYLTKPELIGKHFRHITSRRAIRSVYQNFQKAFEAKKAVEPFEFIYRGVDGVEYTGELVVAPILEDDVVIGTRGIVRDISARVKAESLLREAKEAAEKRAAQLAALNRVGATVSHSLNLREILNSICQELTEIFPIRNAGISLLTQDHKWLEIVAFHASLSEEASALGIFLPYEGNAASQAVINTKRTVVVQDAQNDPSTLSVADIYKTRGTKAIMIVPLLARGEAIGTIGMPAKDPDHVFTQDEIDLAETIASQIATTIDNARLHAKTELKLDIAENDLEIGRQIQAGFFPAKLPEISGWEVAAYFQPARQVSGDFYDVFQFKNSNLTAFIIADVCDKGVGAALFMVLFRSLLRAFSKIKIDARNVQEQLLSIILNTNNYIAEYHGKSNMFATIFFGILNPEDGAFYYINGGHEPPVILDKSGTSLQRLLPTGPAVGLFPDLDFQVEQVKFNEGDFLLGFTDGGTDAKDSVGRHFSEVQLLKTIANPWTSIFSMVYELNTELKRHIGGQPQFDDITLLALRRRTNQDKDLHAICRNASMANLGELIGFVEAAAAHSSLKQDDIFAFKLAADEICTNIIQHGFEGREPGLLSLFFDIEAHHARLIIRDNGHYFSPDWANKPEIDADWNVREMGGLGFYFVSQLIDKVSYYKSGDGINTFVLEKEITTSIGKKE